MVGRTIAQLLPAGFAVTGGTLAFAGDDLVTMDARSAPRLLGRDIVFIPQEPLSALNPVLTDRPAVRRASGAHRRRGARRRERMLAAFEAVHLPHGADLLTRYPHQLSGGMCQRVLIAMAFASKPKLVIADEPTTALDVTIQARIVKLIAEMQERDGTAVMFITHDLRLAAQICDEILVLYAGRPPNTGRRASVRHAGPSLYALPAAREPRMSGERRGLYALPERMPGLRAYDAISGLRFCAALPACDPRCTQRAAAVRRDRRRLMSRPASAPDAHRRSSRPPLRLPAETPAANAADPRSVARDEALRLGRAVPPLRVPAVRNVSFALDENEFVGIVGESGSGKSTLARLVVGLETPSEGRIAIAGRDVDGERRRRRASPPPCADGVSGPAIGAQSAPPRRQHRDAADRSGGHRDWEERLAARRPAARARSACRPRPRRAFRRSSPAGSGSASTSRARSAPCRASWSPTRSCPASTCRCRRSCSNLLPRCAASAASPCCSSRMIFRSCAICATACW